MRLHPETELDRALRHVRESEEIVARQAEIVDELAGLGQTVGLALARRLLTNMSASLELQRHHVREIEARFRRAGESVKSGSQ